ncbi:hypothetical protein BpHYR1_011400, partial [Brachionus plicatilis]
IKPLEYKIDDLVLLTKPSVTTGLSKKLAHKWEGPFLELDKIGAVNYKIKKVQQPKSKTKKVHQNRLKRFFGNYTNLLDDDVIEKLIYRFTRQKSRHSWKSSDLERHRLPGKQRQEVNEIPSVMDRTLVNINQNTREGSSEPETEPTNDDSPFLPNQYLRGQAE